MLLCAAPLGESFPVKISRVPEQGMTGWPCMLPACLESTGCGLVRMGTSRHDAWCRRHSQIVFVPSQPVTEEPVALVTACRMLC
jgi:hypothetical protein